MAKGVLHTRFISIDDHDSQSQVCNDHLSICWHWHSHRLIVLRNEWDLRSTNDSLFFLWLFSLETFHAFHLFNWNNSHRLFSSVFLGKNMFFVHFSSFTPTTNKNRMKTKPIYLLSDRWYFQSFWRNSKLQNTLELFRSSSSKISFVKTKSSMDRSCSNNSTLHRIESNWIEDKERHEYQLRIESRRCFDLHEKYS